MKRSIMTSITASTAAILLAVGLSACQDQAPVSGGSTGGSATATEEASPETPDPGDGGSSNNLVEADYEAPEGSTIAQYLSFTLVPEGLEIYDADDPTVLALLPPDDDAQGLLAQIIAPDLTTTEAMEEWSSPPSLTNAEYTLGIDTNVGGLNAGTFRGTGIDEDGRYVTDRAAYVDHEGQGFFFLLRRAADTEAGSEISDDEFYGILDGVVWAD